MTIAKAVVAAVGGLCTVLAGALADNVIDGGEVANLVASAVTAALTVYAVWRTPNRDARQG